MAQLRRALGLVECTLMGVGVILGAGIYALVGKAAGLAGNAVWLSFALAALVAGFTGLSYAELSSFIPKAGGQYYYAQRAFGNFAAFLVTWLLYLGLSVAVAAVALGFGGYFAALLPVRPVHGAVLLIAAATAVLLYGIKQSAWVAAVGTALELFGLAMVVAVGLPRLGSVDYLATPPAGAVGVLSAAALIFFAYIGFEEIVQLSEEARNPTRNIPLAVLLSIAVTTVLYVVVALSAVSVLGWQRLGQSEAPLADVVAASLGQRASYALSMIALFSTGNTVLILILSSARLMYGMAQDGSLPRRLASVHRRRQTPHVATIVTALLAIAVVLGFETIELAANLTNFALLTTFAVINAAVIVLRYKQPDTPRPFRIPVNIGKFPLLPLLGVASTVLMLINVGYQAAGIGAMLCIAGALVFALRRSFSRRTIGPPGS
jgi:APA family basic amino acid/polyamine antiporter